LEFYKQRKKNGHINSNKLTESFYLQQYAYAFKIHVWKINLEQEYENHFIFKKHNYRERFFVKIDCIYVYGITVCFKDHKGNGGNLA